MTLDPEVRVALARSHFASLPEEVLTRLTAGAMRVDFPPEAELIAPGTKPRLLLLVSGLAKTYLVAHNGRQATVRYARAGDILASVAVYDFKPNLPGSRTLTPTAVLI